MGGTGFSSIPPRLSSMVSFCAAPMVVVLALILNGALVCDGGKTSTFVRKVEKTIDMPLDSDVFRVPPGYNAPQQVLAAYFWSYIIVFLIVLVPVQDFDRPIGSNFFVFLHFFPTEENSFN